VKQQASRVEVQFQYLSVIEKMKMSQEVHVVQQWVIAIQSRFMKATQRLQSVQEEACTLFEEIEGQAAKLEQVVTTVEQCLEGTVTQKLI
jgi:hypothetical protein